MWCYPQIKPILLTVLFLNLLFLEGCSNKKEGGYCTFESHPQGATVLVGDQKGITPCRLRIGRGTQKVSMIHPEGITKQMILTDFKKLNIDFYKLANRTSSAALKTLSIPFFLLCIPVWGIAFWQPSTMGRYSGEVMDSGIYLFCGIVATPGMYLWQKSNELDDEVEGRGGSCISKNYVFVDFYAKN